MGEQGGKHKCYWLKQEQGEYHHYGGTEPPGIDTTEVMVNHDDDDYIVTKDEEYAMPNIESSVKESVEKVKVESSITSYNISIKGRGISVKNQSNMVDDSDSDDEQEELEYLFRLNNDNFTEDDEHVNDTRIINDAHSEKVRNVSSIVKHDLHSATLSPEYLILILLLLLFVILLPSRFPQCVSWPRYRRIYPHRSSPVNYKVCDKAEPKNRVSIPQAIVGKYLFIASKIGNIHPGIENHNNTIEEDITEINI